LGQYTVLKDNGTLNLGPQDVTAISFGLGYGPVDPGALGVCIGCGQIPISTLETGTTFQFDASNSSDFPTFTSRITDGVPEMLVSIASTWVNGTPYAGGGDGQIDSEFFATATTWQISFVRLIINDFSVDPYEVSGHSLSTNITWQIWGTGDPQPPATKEDCKQGRWQSLRQATGMPFRNQGDCVSYVAAQHGSSH
jgi:hypothetical protein